MSVLPLPRTPEFPVIGLDGSWHGRRWLAQWSFLAGQEFLPAGDLLWTVELGHRASDEAAAVMVTTVAKHPAMPLGERSWVGPTGLVDAARGALLGALEHVAPSGAERGVWLRDQMTGMGRPGRLPFEGEWSPVSVMVDGETVAGLRLGRQHCWILIADLPEVSIGMWGDGVDPSELGLVQVNLSAYPLLAR